MLLRPSLLAARPAAGGGGGGYVAKAVHFDGATWLRNASLTATNSSQCTWSGWAKGTIDTATKYMFDFDPAGFEFGPTFSNANFFQFWPATDGATDIEFTSDGLVWIDDKWNHIFGYVDTNHPAGEKIIAIFFNGVQITGTIADTADAFVIPFANVVALPDTTEDRPVEFAGDMCDWWVGPGVLETDITVFRDPVTGKPKNPSGFPSGAILFSGDATGFPVNQGTGGAFTLTGTLTNATTSPSD